MAATVPVDHAGDTSPLLEAAQRIGRPDEESDEDPTPGGGPGVDPQPGSLEAFMTTFGARLAR